MANSYVEIPVTGVDSYAFPFPYLEQSHIQVYAGGVLQTLGVHYTFTDSNTIEFSVDNVPTDTNTVIFIKRVTDNSGRLVTYSNTGLDADDLNLGSNQNFYLAQEAVDAAELNITRGLDGTTTVGGRLSNVTDPVNAQDAATKAYVASQLTQSATGGVYIQTTAPDGAIVGDLWVNSDTNVMSVYTASGWSTGSTVEGQTFLFTSAHTSTFGGLFTISTFAYGLQNISDIDQVFLNGVLLKECTVSIDFTSGDWDRTLGIITLQNNLGLDDELTVLTSSRLSSETLTSVQTVNDNLVAINAAGDNATDAEDARDAAIVAQGLSETARDDTLVSQQAALVSQEAAEAAKDVIVDGDYLQHKLGTVQIEANTSLRLLGGVGTNYIYAKNQFDANTVTSSVVANYGWDFFRVRQPLTIDKPLTLTSPDTLITKELSINNSGQLIFDGTVIS